MISIEHDTTELCRPFVDSILDELTAYSDFWLVWNALPRGKREAIRLRIHDQLKNLTSISYFLLTHAAEHSQQAKTTIPIIKSDQSAQDCKPHF